MMRTIVWAIVTVFVLCLAIPATAGKGFMGGKGSVVVDDSPTDGGGGGGSDTVEGPLNDNMSDAGSLYGDLYKIHRYKGGEIKMEPEVDSEGNAVFNADGLQDLVPGAEAVGGEPILSEGYGSYALEVAEGVYELATAPYPSQCVQPVADFAKWGNINGVTGLDSNRLPLIVSYDATWLRSECEVGELLGVSVDTGTGAITYDKDTYFIPPCADVTYDPGECTWNGVVYCDGVLWGDLVDEVHFGRLNLARAPEGVSLAAFDEAVSAINNATSISRDAAGRLLLTTDIYEELVTAVDGTCTQAYVKTITKAIDSPLENLAIYEKLLKDGHLVTPGDQRAPIDRSKNGGIPLWKMLGLSDGPSDALRPTIDIAKLRLVFPNLVDVTEVDYYTYYECYTEAGAATACLCEEISHDGVPTNVACADVATRELQAVDACPDPVVNSNAESCKGPWTGIKTSDEGVPWGEDYDFAAAFVAAAADKTGDIGQDMLVYLNSTLGINQVVGYSDDGVDYSKYPIYYNFINLPTYSRNATIGTRGVLENGWVTVLQGASPDWTETTVDMLDGSSILFENQELSSDGYTGYPATMDISGFTQMADDNLRVIEFVHTFQIPGLR